MTICFVRTHLSLATSVLPVLACLATACGDTPTAQGGPCRGTIAVATDLPLSGPEEQSGQSAQQAAQLAVEQAQGVNLLYGCHIQLIANDDASDPNQALQNLAILIANRQVIGIAGPIDDAVAKSELPISHSSIFPQVAPRTTDSSLTTANPTTFFRVTPDATGEAKAILQALPEVGKLFVGSDGSAWGTQLGTALAQAATDGGVAVVSDFSGSVNQQQQAALSQTFGAVLYAGSLAAAGQLHHALQIAGVQIPFWIGDSVIDPPLSATDSTNLEGVTKAFLGSDVGNPIVNKNFSTDFKTRFGAQPDWYAGNEYDATNILLYAAKRVLDQTGDTYPQDMLSFRRALVAAIASIQWDGATGHTSFDAEGLSHHVWVVLEQLHGGKWRFSQTEQIAA